MAQSVIAGPDKNPTVVNSRGVGVRVGFEITFNLAGIARSILSYQYPTVNGVVTKIDRRRKDCIQVREVSGRTTTIMPFQVLTATPPKVKEPAWVKKDKALHAALLLIESGYQNSLAQQVAELIREALKGEEE